MPILKYIDEIEKCIFNIKKATKVLFGEADNRRFSQIHLNSSLKKHLIDAFSISAFRYFGFTLADFQRTKGEPKN